MDKYDDIIIRAAQKWLPEDYDWRLFKAQLFQESSLNPLAVSPAGAVGIAQIMPATWAQWSVKAGHEGALPTDVTASIETGACYLGMLIQKWHWPRPTIDRQCLALASYNAGFGNILKAQKIAGGVSGYKEIIGSLCGVTGPKSCYETTNYARSIFNHYLDYVM